MDSLTSRKLAAVISSILGLIALAAIQAFQGGLSEQQFNLLAVGIVGLGGGNVLVQGAIDGIKINGTSKKKEK
jgi:hypothetical protein